MREKLTGTTAQDGPINFSGICRNLHLKSLEIARGCFSIFYILAQKVVILMKKLLNYVYLIEKTPKIW